jgi:hypothetical protein
MPLHTYQGIEPPLNRGQSKNYTGEVTCAAKKLYVQNAWILENSRDQKIIDHL